MMADPADIGEIHEVGVIVKACVRICCFTLFMIILTIASCSRYEQYLWNERDREKRKQMIEGGATTKDLYCMDKDINSSDALKAYCIGGPK
jgi:hypothetical protein